MAIHLPVDQQNLCFYYHAQIKRNEAWFFVSVLKSWEHVAFDRTIDVERSLFEFFVPPSMEPYFLQLMQLMEKQGVVTNLQKLPNRLADPLELV